LVFAQGPISDSFFSDEEGILPLFPASQNLEREPVARVSSVFGSVRRCTSGLVYFF
jgi:hypothetical protein